MSGLESPSETLKSAEIESEATDGNHKILSALHLRRVSCYHVFRLTVTITNLS